MNSNETNNSVHKSIFYSLMSGSFVASSRPTYVLPSCKHTFIQSWHTLLLTWIITFNTHYKHTIAFITNPLPSNDTEWCRYWVDHHRSQWDGAVLSLRSLRFHPSSEPEFLPAQHNHSWEFADAWTQRSTDGLHHCHKPWGCSEFHSICSSIPWSALKPVTDGYKNMWIETSVLLLYSQTDSPVLNFIKI